MELILSTRNACCGYGSNIVLSDINIDVRKGEVLCILGPNGVGKTTLFKTILGLIELKSGDILVESHSIKKMSSKNKARLMGYVPQVHDPPFSFKVSDVVMMGRTAYIGNFSTPGREDRRVTQEAMASLRISNLEDRIYTELSGGERQLVLIARALAQQPKILIMDEPTSNLDFGNQIRVLQQINALTQNGLSVILTTHFPNHAFMCASKVAMVKKDKSIEIGTSEEVITEENLYETYGINVKITLVHDSNGGTVKTCVPLLNNANH